MTTAIQCLFRCGVLALCFQPLAAAEKIPFPLEVSTPGVAFSESIPKPEKVIGHQVGTRHTRPHQIVQYFEAVAQASPRVTLGRHGTTYEGRPLIHALVTSPENHQRLERIREENLQLSDAPAQVSDALLERMPVVVNMGYSVHGNEASGSEASLLLLYYLAGGQGESVEDMLERAVVIIDPSLNPDGRSRFVNWVNGNRAAAATADPQHREHNEPWPGGRTNHYWFDLNRDWLPAQLPESQGRLELFHRWRPQVLTDFHEMGSESTYFFQPGVPARNHPLTPARTIELTYRIGEYHALALDRIGSLYYTEETFDDFYYGKGSTYPDVNGAVGILFEQASSRALKREVAAGELEYAFTIRNQFTTSLSTLEAAVSLRRELLDNQREFYATSSEFARSRAEKAYVVRVDQGGSKAAELTRVLMRHRILAYRPAQDIQSEGTAFPATDSIVVPLDQPQSRLIQSMMETVTEFEDSIFYDVSTWTFPLAFGLEAAALTSSPPLGPVIEDPDELIGARQVGVRAGFAYLLEWGSYYAPRALYRFQRTGGAARLLMEPVEIEVDGRRRRFERGAVVIPVARLGEPIEGVHEAAEEAARLDHVSIFALDSGATLSGPDLGSPSAKPIRKPEIALLSGAGTASYQVGETWFLLGERMGIPVTLLDLSTLGSADLSRYNTIVATAGAYRDLDDSEIAKLKERIERGATLIAIQTGSRWAIQKGLVEEALKEQAEFSTDVPYAEVAAARGAQVIGGAIFEASVDPTHPIAFGYGRRVAVFRDHDVLYQPSESPGANVALYTSAPLRSGYISAERLAELQGTAAVIARRQGSGSVVLFADNPNFRAFWLGTQSLFLNAVFFGGAF
ncbi:MAG TPA: M14 metallopeptidase family protein [Acidobacteriota bacterium]|nr:M14 metallopeptidase family protein [Acidobacteriota bacterium]